MCYPVKRNYVISVMPQRCCFDVCLSKVAMIVGHCRYCTNDFCLKHRLPESHKCTAQSECEASAKRELEAKLLTDAANARQKNV